VTLSFATAAERPDLVAAMWAIPSTWPEFMFGDAVANVFYPQLANVFPEHQLMAIDNAGSVIGRVNSVPFAWSGADEALPNRGWDAIIESAFASHETGEPTTAVSLLEARISPQHQGAGFSTQLLVAARNNVRRLGVRDLFGPVRPTGKALEPFVPMAQYIARRRPDGLPEDPWLRVHVRLGARLVKVCPASMTVSASLQQWRQWTGLPLTHTGLVAVAGALTPLHVSAEHDHAVYVESNVWVHHRVPAQPAVLEHVSLPRPGARG
jgi:hypothetical protein